MTPVVRPATMIMRLMDTGPERSGIAIGTIATSVRPALSSTSSCVCLVALTLPWSMDQAMAMITTPPATCRDGTPIEKKRRSPSPVRYEAAKIVKTAVAVRLIDFRFIGSGRSAVRPMNVGIAETGFTTEKREMQKRANALMCLPSVGGLPGRRTRCYPIMRSRSIDTKPEAR